MIITTIIQISHVELDAESLWVFMTPNPRRDFLSDWGPRLYSQGLHAGSVNSVARTQSFTTTVSYKSMNA